MWSSNLIKFLFRVSKTFLEFLLQKVWLRNFLELEIYLIIMTTRRRQVKTQIFYSERKNILFFYLIPYVLLIKFFCNFTSILISITQFLYIFSLTQPLAYGQYWEYVVYPMPRSLWRTKLLIYRKSKWDAQVESLQHRKRDFPPSFLFLDLT